MLTDEVGPTVISNLQVFIERLLAKNISQNIEEDRHSSYSQFSSFLDKKENRQIKMKYQKNYNCWEENKKEQCNKKSALDCIIGNWISEGLIFKALNNKSLPY